MITAGSPEPGTGHCRKVLGIREHGGEGVQKRRRQGSSRDGGGQGWRREGTFC